MHNERLVLAWVPRVRGEGEEMGSHVFIWESHTESKRGSLAETLGTQFRRAPVTPVTHKPLLSEPHSFL